MYYSSSSVIASPVVVEAMWNYTWHKKITEDCFLYMFPVLLRTLRNSWGWWPGHYLNQLFCTLKAISECIVHKPEALHWFLSNCVNSTYIFSIIPGNLGQRNLNTLSNSIYRLSLIFQSENWRKIYRHIYQIHHYSELRYYYYYYTTWPTL